MPCTIRGLPDASDDTFREAAVGAGFAAVVLGETRPGVFGSHVDPDADLPRDPDLGHDDLDEPRLGLRCVDPRAPLLD